jgi:hypothetical protein
MRRFTGTEFGIFALAGIFIIVGSVMVIHPTEGVVFHQAYRWVGSSVEHVSKERTRAYGVLAILFGFGFVWMVFANRRK